MDDTVKVNLLNRRAMNFSLKLPFSKITFFKKGLQSPQLTSELRQQMSLALERQLNGQFINSAYASSLMNLPLSSQSCVSALNSLNNIPALPSVKSSAKQHPPLTASNSVANCNAASHLKALTTREHRKLDRSVSEPVRPLQANSSRYKTELCRPFEENGTCKYGDKCQFAHGIGELRTLSRHPKYKTELCRTFHSTGFCPYGPRCHFIHNSEDSKKCLMNNLQNGNNANEHSVQGTLKEYDDGYSIDTPSQLSPISSSSSCSSSGGSLPSASPPSSFKGYFLDDNQQIFSLPQVPQTAPPTLSGGVFFPDYMPLKPSLMQKDEFLPSQEECLDEDVISSLDMLVSDLDINCDTNSNASLFSKPTQSAAIDINRNIIRLPFFNSLAVGNSP